MARDRLHEDIRQLVRSKPYHETSLLAVLEERGEITDGNKALQEMLLSGELIQAYKYTSKYISIVLCVTSDAKDSEPPIVLRPLLDMSRRIYQALFTYRMQKEEVSRAELQALVKQVYNIERFTPEDYEQYFEYGLARAVASGKIEMVSGGKQTMYRSGDRKRELLVCALCDNHLSDIHERKLECKNCRWQRHASCMGLRKHKITGVFECERCTKCAECRREPTACNPLAWCPACYRPKHVRGCGENEQQQGAELAFPPTVHLCKGCGGDRLPTPSKDSDRSLSPCLSLPATSSSASAADMATPRSDRSVNKLQDSLSGFFLPSAEGRRRHKRSTYEETPDDGDFDDRPSHMHPLTVDINGEAGSSTGMPSKTPPSSAASSSHHHHHKKGGEGLVDSLSPKFIPASDKRRSVSKGEFARMQGGSSIVDAGAMLSPGYGHAALLSPKRRGRPPRTSSLIGSPPSSAKEEEEEEAAAEEETNKMASPRKSNGHMKKGAGEQWKMQGRSTQNSASAALFSSPDEDRRKSKGSKKVAGSDSEENMRRSKPLSRLSSSQLMVTTPKSPAHKRIKREPSSTEEEEEEGDQNSSQLDSEDSDDKPLMRRAAGGLRTPSAAAAAAAPAAASKPSTSAAGVNGEKKSSKKRKDEPMKSASRKEAVRAQSPIESTGTGAGSSVAGYESWSDLKITAEQWSGYEACTQKANEAIEKTALLSADGSEIPRWPETIRFGRFEMETWFTAPYPNEYANTKKLFICEFCLKYMRTLPQLIRHAKKCQEWHPPGNEIYRKDDVSVFEVDGNVAGIYCQNLCLLAKLYLDHKTLYYDVEPFLFYIVTRNDRYGCHFVGYFSKEKYSAQKFNLSCIVTLPSYHKQGFGRFLIDFSYLLTRRERMVGTPERPLSDLGRVSYAAYWKSALLEYLRKKIRIEKKEEIRLDEISMETGISPYDAVSVLEALGMLVKSENSGLEFIYKDDLVEGHWKRAQANKERIWLDESALKWQATAHTPSKDFATVRSPPRLASPTPSHGVTPTGVPVAACGSTIKRGPLAAANACPAGSAAAAAAAAAGTAAANKKNAAARLNNKKRPVRQLKLEDMGFIASPKATSTPARKSKRIAAASEDSSLASTSSDDEEKKPDTKSPCKPDSKRRNLRSDDSDDSSDEERNGGGGGGGTPKKQRPSATAPGPSSSATTTGRRASGASRGGGAPSTPKGRKRAGRGRESEEDEEGEVSSVYALTSSSSESESDEDTSFRPSSGRRPPPPSKGKKGSKGGKPSIPKKGGKAPQKGKKNGVTSGGAPPAPSSSSPPVMVNKRKKELKSPGKVFPPNYLQTIAARSQQAEAAAAAAAAAAESAAAPGCSSSQAAACSAAAGEGNAADDARPSSPADSLCSTATMPMRQAPDAADQSMMTDDAHESDGREHTPGPSASALSSRPPSSIRGRRMDRRRNGRPRRETSDESDSSLGASSSGSSLYRGASSPRPMGERTAAASGGTMNMGWDEEETDHDRTMRMEQLDEGAGAPASASSASERPPSLQAMSPIAQRPPEEPDEEQQQQTLGSLLSHEMSKAAAAAASSSPLLQMSQLARKASEGLAAAAAAAMPAMMNGLATKPGPSGCVGPSTSAAAAAAAGCSTDDSEDDAPPCLSPQYARECDGEMAGMGGRGGASSSNEDGGASSDASAAPVLAPSNVSRSISLDHTALAAASSSSSAGPSGSSNHGMIGRRISDQSCAAAAAYDPFSTPPKAPLPHADQLLPQRPIDVGVSHQELNFGMAPNSLHGRLSGGEAGPGPPSCAQTSPHLQQQQQHMQMQQQTTPIMQQQHSTSQMMAYPGSASGGGMQSTPGSVPSAHNTPDMQLQQQSQTMQPQMQQFASPPMQQQMYTQQPSSVHSTHSGHHDMSGGGGGPGSVPAGYGQQMIQGGHSNPSTPLRAMGGPGSANQPAFNSPTPMPQPLSVPDHHAAAAAAAAAAPGRRSSEAASASGPPAATAAAAASAAPKKRSSAGGSAAASAQPQLQQQQQIQFMHNQMMMQNMQYMQYMQQQYNHQVAAYNNGYMHSPWAAAGAAAQQFPQMTYPAGMMPMPTGKNGTVMGPTATAAAGIAAAAAATSFYMPPYPAAMQPMHQQQQQQQAQAQQQRVAAATAAAAAAQWQQRPTLGPPFPGAAVGTQEAGANFLNGAALPTYPFQQAQTFPQQY